MLAFPMRMWKGDVPNVDFLHLYGPGALYVLMGWSKLFGDTLTAERTFGLIQHLGIIFGLFTLARPWGRKAATAVGALAVFYVITPIGLTAMALERRAGVAVVERGVRRAGHGARRTAAARDRRAHRRRAGRAGARLPPRPGARRRAGARLVAVDAAPPVGRHRSLGVGGRADADVGAPRRRRPGRRVRGMFVDPVFHLRAGRELPRPPSWSHLDGALQAIAETEPPWWPLPHLAASNALFLWFVAMLVSTVAVPGVRACGGAGATARRARRRCWWSRSSRSGSCPKRCSAPTPRTSRGSRASRGRSQWSWSPKLRTSVRPRIGAGRALAIGGALRARPHVHADIAVHVPLLPPAHAGEPRPRAGGVRGRARRPPLLLRIGAEPRSPRRRPSTTSTGWSSPATACSSGRRTCAAPGTATRCSTGCSRRLTPATYFMEMDPGLANAPGSRLADDLASADCVILTSFWDGWREPNTSMDFGSNVPNEIIERHFCQWNSYQQGLVRLYYRCRVERGESRCRAFPQACSTQRTRHGLPSADCRADRSPAGAPIRVGGGARAGPGGGAGR